MEKTLLAKAVAEKKTRVHVADEKIKDTDKKSTIKKGTSGSRLFIGMQNNNVLVLLYPIGQEESVKSLKENTLEHRTYDFTDISLEDLDKLFVYYGFKQGPIKFKQRTDSSKPLEFDILYHEDFQDTRNKENSYNFYLFDKNHKKQSYSLAQRISESQRDLIKTIDKLIS
jgi:hypothetical protein